MSRVSLGSARASGFSESTAAPARARRELQDHQEDAIRFKCWWAQMKAGTELCHWASFQFKFVSGSLPRANPRRTGPGPACATRVKFGGLPWADSSAGGRK